MSLSTFTRPLFIAVDFDGTLCENNFPGIGSPNMEVIKWVLDQQKNHGAKLLLWTVRNKENGRDYLQEAIDWSAHFGIHFDGINENPFWDLNSRKMYADIYLDDRAMNIDYIRLLSSHN